MPLFLTFTHPDNNFRRACMTKAVYDTHAGRLIAGEADEFVWQHAPDAATALERHDALVQYSLNSEEAENVAISQEDDDNGYD